MEKPDWFEIPRETPIVNICINGSEVSLSYADTAIYKYPKGLEHFNHVYIQDMGYLFGFDDFVEKLEEQGFPRCELPFPSDEDVEAFIKCVVPELEKM
jgi:hypothetical protein